MFEKGVSFILPFYNAQRTLARTIESIIDTGLADFEIHCINDGSTDRSLEIVQYWSSRCKAIKTINIENNLGVSNARNTGLSLATKDFVFFIDSDDLLGPSFFNDIDISCDIAIGGHTIVNGLETLNGFDFGMRGILDRSETENLIRRYLSEPKGNSIITHCWGKLYNRSFLYKYNIKFDNRISIYEDIKFVATCLSQVKNIYVFQGCTYLKNISNGLGTKFYDAPLAYQESFAMLSKVVGKTEKDVQDLYKGANTYYVAKSLFSAKDLPVFKIRKLIIDLQIEFKNIQTHRINNRKIALLIDVKIYRIPLIMAILLRCYGFLRWK